MENTLQALTLALVSSFGVSGCEESVRSIAEQWLSPIGACETTPLGSLICRMKVAAPDKPHLLLTAHFDQIGMIVTQVMENGFLRVAPVGGCDRAVLPASQVQIHTQEGILAGVVCTVPPHLSNGDNMLPKVEELAIDIGFSGEEAKKRVAPGDRVTCMSQPLQLKNGRFCAQALDNRAGCAAVIWAARELASMQLDCSLTVLLTSMEEVGEQGALTGAQYLNPTHSIIVDVTFAHTPDAKRSECGEMSKGAMLGIAPILDNTMFKTLQQTAAREEIPIQIEVMSNSTGTDTDKIAVSGAGVRCAMLSIPLRYMHTPTEVIDFADVETVSRLITAYTRAEFGGAV